MNNQTIDTFFKYELFFELSPDLLCIAGYDGYFKKVNAAVPKLLCYSLQELYATPINEFVYQEDKPRTSSMREELVKSKPLFNFENRYVTKTGEVVWLSWTSLPVEEDQLIFAIAKDITHKKKLETERNFLLANLAKANKELKELSYTTSHDLRSPVNNLLAIFDMIDSSRISDAETLELMGILRSSGEHLKKTLNNGVDILTKGDCLGEDREEVDLNGVLQNVLQSISSLVERAHAKFDINFEQMEKMTLNKACLESIFLNLITNSIKYARPGCLPIISIFSERLDGVRRLTIADNGLGFDLDKVKDKMFGMHQKFHNHADSKGVGLYLVNTHVTNVGGSIQVESKVNEGAKFIITFPDDPA
jgi:PAS domain S-box-containing protein